ncbi:MAG: DUF4153 domain-containing protein [Bacteroidaceae bacterium]|nr:DUF4153 domain-containing protein [Bacteroidaceae bacterium]
MKLSSTPQAIVRAFQMCVKRFPVPSAFITVLSLFLIFNTIDEGDMLSEKAVGSVSYYLSVGYLLSLTLRLWEEEGWKQRTVLIVNIVAHLILLADAIYVYHALADYENCNWELVVARAAAIFSLWLSLFFLSFFKEKDNIASWNFTMRLMANFVICYMIGNIMWGGLSLLLASLDTLFGIDFHYKWYGVLGILTSLFLSTWLFLGRMPEGKEKHDREPIESGFLNAVMRFLFLPLVGLYIIVLYIYAAQILVRWELPNGWVSWLVVTSMIGLIVIEFGLYPIRKLQNKRTDNLIARYLPVAILPLLLLMTVGIIRRFNDYGITVNRLYLITLNLWFYFVCITLFLTKARRINWITISFALIFLLTSAFPINYLSITRNYMESHIEKTLADKQLPLNAKQYEQLLRSMPKEEAIQLNDQIRYIRNYYGCCYTEAYVKDSTYISFYYDFLEDDPYTIDVDTVTCPISNSLYHYDIDIPEGYSRMVKTDNLSVSCKEGQKMVKFVPTLGEETFDTVFVNLDTLRTYANKMDAPIQFPCSTDKTLYYATYFCISEIDKEKGYDVSVTGFIIQKK